MNFKISIALISILAFGWASKAQKMSFTYSNGFIVTETISGGSQSVEVGSSADCATEEVSIELDNVDSAHWKDGFKGINRNLTITSGALYHFAFYYANGCSDSSSVYIDPAVPANTRIEGPAQVSNYGESYAYKAFGGVKSTYSWTFEGDSISDVLEDNASVVWKRHQDTFKVWVTESSVYGCDGKPALLPVLNNFVSISQAYHSTLKIYPNPVKSTLTVEGLESTAGSYSIYSSKGELLAGGRLGKSIQVDELPPGQYLLKVISESGVSNHLITKL